MEGSRSTGGRKRRKMNYKEDFDSEPSYDDDNSTWYNVRARPGSSSSTSSGFSSLVQIESSSDSYEVSESDESVVEMDVEESKDDIIVKLKKENRELKQKVQILENKINNLKPVPLVIDVLPVDNNKEIIQSFIPVPKYSKIVTDEGMIVTLNFGGHSYSYFFCIKTNSIHTNCPLLLKDGILQVNRLDTVSIMTEWKNSGSGVHFGHSCRLSMYDHMVNNLSSISNGLKRNIKQIEDQCTPTTSTIVCGGSNSPPPPRPNGRKEPDDGNSREPLPPRDNNNNIYTGCGSTLFALLKQMHGIKYDSIRKIIPCFNTYTSEVINRFLRFYSATYNKKSNFEIHVPPNTSKLALNILLMLCDSQDIKLQVPLDCQVIHDDVTKFNLKQEFSQMKETCVMIREELKQFAVENQSVRDVRLAITKSGLPIYIEETDNKESLKLYESVLTRLKKADFDQVKAVYPEISKAILRAFANRRTNERVEFSMLVHILPKLKDYLDERDDKQRTENNEANSSDSEQSPTNDSLNTCKVCKKNFLLRRTLLNHMRLHNDNSFDCTLCFKKFPTKHRLVCHTRTHTGEKPYQCSKCGLRFTISSNLRSHNKNIDCLSTEKLRSRRSKFTGKRH